jgi:hypothetical protein
MEGTILFLLLVIVYLLLRGDKYKGLYHIEKLLSKEYKDARDFWYEESRVNFRMYQKNIEEIEKEKNEQDK